MKDKAQPDPQSPGRRAAIKRLGRAVGVLAVGAVALPSAGCAALVDPDAVTELPLAEIPEGRKMILHAGKRVELTRRAQTITARLMICTHEACDLTWYDGDGDYRCTCHDGHFYADGNPKSGPVSRPMFEIPTRLNGDLLVIGPAGELSL